MLFDRQRVLLELLDALNEPVGPTDFQKLLFLFTREVESTPSYEFVPYRFGCFSFTCYADKRRLVEQELIEDSEHWNLTAKGRRVARAGARSPLPLARFAKKHEGLRDHSLVTHVYRQYPYFATRSEILDQVLPNPSDRRGIELARPVHQPAGLVTIGYEGKSLETYLNQLIQNGVTLLCDVRRNPLSRKYGFSKSTLSHACEGIGVRYEHLPSLGIPSDKRQELETQADYDRLFSEYQHKVLPRQTSTLIQIARWIQEDGQRIALTCFELKPQQCHRHCVADALRQTFGPKLAAQHL